MKILLDLTRALPNSEQSLLNRAFAAYPGLQSADLTIFRLSHHSRLPLGEDVVLQAGTHYTVVAQVVFEKLRSLLSTQPPNTIHVASFHKSVFDLQSRLSPDQQAQVSFRSFKSLSVGFPPSSTVSAVQAAMPIVESQPASAQYPTESLAARSTDFPGPQAPAAPPFVPSTRWPAELIPLPDAIAVLEAALDSVSAVNRDHAVRHTDLRPLLSRIDRRLDKSQPLAATPGFISMLVRAAEDAGSIQLDRQDLTNPRVWLAKGLDVRPVPGRPGLAPRVSATRRSSRSQIFLDILRAARMGPFSSIRLDLFDALQAATDRGPITVGELIKRTVDLTRVTVARPEHDDSRYPWRSVREFLTQLLARRSILLSEDGSPVPTSFGSLGASVHRLQPGWRLDLDGELLIELVSSGADIRLVDVPALAGALYFERSDDKEALAAEVVGHLLRIGRLTESDDGAHRLQLPPLS